MALKLHQAWNYWFFKGLPTEEDKKNANSPDEAYKNNMIKMEHDITTVQDFWVCNLELPKPSELHENKQGFLLCRTGVRPFWEDEEMKEGGIWTWMVEDSSVCDNFWRYILMAAIGQRFTSKDIENDEVVAVQNEYNVAKANGSGGTRINIWHKRASKKDKLKDRVKEILEKEVKGVWDDATKTFHRKTADMRK